MAYNASQTKSPVCYDMTVSPWQAYHRGYMFVFSTMKHRDKFLDEVVQREQWLSDSMSRRFHLPCKFNILAALQLYMQIEGRGFRVWNDDTGEVYEKPSDVMITVDAHRGN